MKNPNWRKVTRQTEEEKIPDKPEPGAVWPTSCNTVRFENMSEREKENYLAWKEALNSSSTNKIPLPNAQRTTSETSEPNNFEDAKAVVSDVAKTGFDFVEAAVWGAAILAAPFTCGLSLLAAFIYSRTRGEISDKLKK